MTLQDFIKKWDGKGIDFDGYYGDQCMDLMHQYVSEVLDLGDIQILAQPNAKSVYTNFKNVFGREYFEQIPNTLEAVPEEGDVIFWGYNPSGHVAVYVEGDGHTFTSFDQNYPTGSKCHLQKHTYRDVLGWLRFKKPVDPCAEKIAELEKEKDFFEKLSKEQTKTIKVMENDLKEQQEELEALQKERDVFHDISERTSEEVKELKISIEDALKKAEDWEADYIELETQLTTANNLYNKQVGVIEKLEAEKKVLHTANKDFMKYSQATKLFKYKNYLLVLIEEL